MSVELLQDCVVIPNKPDWHDGVRISDLWQSSIVPAVTDAEDRTGGRSVPLVRQEHSIVSFTPQERARLNARLLEAKRKGRAAVPLWARAQYLATEDITTESATEGLWPWKDGDYAFFCRTVRDLRFTHENKELFLNCGGDTVEKWGLDSAYASGGDVITTGNAINTTGITGYDAPPEAVYQSARAISTDDDALSSTYSSTMRGYVVSGMVVGQTYFYKPGAQDTVMAMLRQDGMPLQSFTGPATFTATTDWCIIYTPSTPGVIRPYRDISFQIPGLIRGIDCRVRLHVAEIEGMDGSASRRIFDVTATGEEIVTVEAVEPYALAGALNKAASVDLRVKPDNDGKVTITVIPSGHDFFACVNAVEFYQYTWEVKQLVTRTLPDPAGTDNVIGTQDNFIVWDGLLKGYYPLGSQVFPVLFGKPIVGAIPAITNWHARVKIAVQEPIGQGDLGVPGLCPIEVCLPDPPLEPPAEDPKPAWPDQPYPYEGVHVFFPSFTDPDGQSLNAGTYDAGGAPDIAGVGTEQLRAWIMATWAQWPAYVAEQWTPSNIVPANVEIYWAFVGSDGGETRWNAGAFFAEAPTYYSQEFPWTLAIRYTVTI